MEYRRDIEGLRAVAVIPVVIFHVAQSYIPGGFVGVDIFFVISGYLISSHILKEHGRGSFSLISFYERRVRRIAPAYLILLMVISVVFIFAAFPSELKSYGQSLMATVASITNIYFWATTNYFALPAEEMPLLHTWSLATEEQFYLIFPIFVISIRRLPERSQQLLVVGILLASLAYSAITASIAPASSFYLIFSRAWELLLGTVLAMRRSSPQNAHPFAMEAVAFVGLLMIVWAMAAFSPDTKFPGLAALVPCLGAVFIIQAGETRATGVSKLLAMPPLRAVGVISYSLYLWHWPVLVLQRMTGFLSIGESRTEARIAVVVVSVVVASLSWAVVERTTRNRAKIATKPLIFGVCSAAVAMFSIGLYLDLSGGLPSRFSPQVQSVVAFLDYDQTEQFRVSTCFLTREDSFAAFDKTACLPTTKSRLTYLVAGDSHAAALSYGFRRALPDVDILQVSGVGCPPVLTLQRSASAACPQLLDLAFSELPAERKIDAVLLVGRWNLGRLGWAPGWNRDWLRELGATVSHLRSKGLDVIIVGPMPEYERELPRVLGESLLRGDAAEPQRLLTRDSFALDREMRDFAKDNGFRYVSLVDALCHEQDCVNTVTGGVPLLFDTDHLTSGGSIWVANAIKDQIENSRTHPR